MKLVAVCDAHADFRQVRAIVDRALLTCCSWMSGYASDDPSFPETHTLHLDRRRRDGDRVTAELSFDPRHRSAELRARNEGDLRHPKRVLRVIVPDDAHRARREVDVFWRADWEAMRALGRENGLSAFVFEVEAFARSRG